MMRRIGGAILVGGAIACGIVDPEIAPKGGTFSIGPDSVEISGPGEIRLQITIADTTKPTITTTGPLSATLEVTGSLSKKTSLIVAASGAGAGYVKLENDRTVDSVEVVATAVAFKKMATSYGFGCGIAADDRAWCWGVNTTRQLGRTLESPCSGGGCQYGNGGSTDWPLPVRGNMKFSMIAVAGYNCAGSGLIGGCGSACALTAGGEAFCWGALAPPGGTTPTRMGPDKVLSTITTASSATNLPGAPALSCGLDAAGAAYCLTATGSNRVGSTMTFTSFSTSMTHSCGISGGDVYCWGANANGQLGIGSSDSNDHPNPEKAVAPVSFTAVATGSLQTCALATSKKIYCWGGGNATPTVLAGGSVYESFSMRLSLGSVCGLTASGGVDCWTLLNDAQPTAVVAPVPLVSIGVGGFRSLGAGGGSSDFGMSCGLSAAGDVYCWKADFVAKKLGAESGL